MKTLLTLKIIAILAVGLMATPAMAREGAYVGGYPTPPRPEREEVEKVVAPLAISSVSPDEVKVGSGAKTITVTGSGFNPSSIVRLNGSNRPTTFIDDSHLLVQAGSNDFYRTDGGFYLTVWNSNGDYSNAGHVAVEGKAAAPASQNNTNQNQNYGNQNSQSYNYPNNNYGYGGYNNQPINYYPGTLETVETDSSLASSVILGGNTFLPSGIVQWVLVAILIVLIVVLGRKIFGAREQYDSAPLKHA